MVRDRWSGRVCFGLNDVCCAKIESFVYVILIRHRLKSQINLGIRLQEVYKELGRKMASETLVGLLGVYFA